MYVCVCVHMLTEAWQSVIDKVQDVRLSAGMKPLSFSGILSHIFIIGTDSIVSGANSVMSLS